MKEGIDSSNLSGFVEIAEVSKQDQSGRRAEVRFRSWCDADLIATRPEYDRHGWDFLVETDQEIADHIPLDRQGGRDKFLVQVKGTQKRAASVNAKLSALKPLIDTDLPAFLAVIETSRNDRGGRLLHLGSAQIEEILRCVREAEAAGKRQDLHKVRVSLSLSEAVEISPGGENLAAAFRSCVNQQPNYAAWKSGFRNSCGYNAGTIGAKFLSSDFQGMLDMMLGRGGSIAVESFQIETKRWGIPLPLDIVALAEGRIELESKPNDTCLVRIRTKKEGRIASFSADVFTVPDFFPKEQHQLRIAHEAFEMIAKAGGHWTFSFKPPIDKAYTLLDLANLLAFGAGLAQNESVLEILRENELVFSHRINGPSGGRWELLAEYADFISATFNRFRPGHTTQMTLRDLTRSFEGNQECFAILRREGLNLGFDVESDGAAPEQARLLVPITMELADLTYAAVVRIDARVERSETRLRFFGRTPTLFEEALVDTNTYGNSWTKRTLERAKQHLAEPNIAIIVPVVDLEG